MFSMRLFFTVAGVLLILNTDQAESTVRQSGSTTYSQEQLLRAARVENENAISFLDKLIPKHPRFKIAQNVLLKTQNYLDELLQHTATNRHETFTETLDSELLGYFGSTKCADDSECDQTYRYVQLATGDIIGAILKENTIGRAKKRKIRQLIKGNITVEGDVVGGASVLQTYEVARKVWLNLGF